MQNESYSRVRVETMGRKTIGCLFFLFLSLFFVAIVIGVTGPTVWSFDSRETIPCNTCTDAALNPTSSCPTPHVSVSSCDECETIFPEIDVTAMNPYHQLLYIEVSIKRPVGNAATDEIYYQQPFTVSASGQGDNMIWEEIADKKKHVRKVWCPAGQEYCQNITVFAENTIRYNTYNMSVHLQHPLGPALCKDGKEPQLDMKLSLVHMNAAFTSYELGFKYTQCALTLLVMLAFFLPLRRVPRRQVSYEQRWIVILLVLLFFFNDPFMVFEVHSASPVPSVLYTIFLVSFITAVLLFWLCIIDVIRTTAEGRESTSKTRGMCFYIPKIILTLGLWFAMISVYLWTRLQQRQDPAYSTPDDFTHFTFFKVVCIVLVALYCLWLLYLIVRAIGEIKRLPSQFMFISALTGLTIVIAVIGIGVGAFSPLPVSLQMKYRAVLPEPPHAGLSRANHTTATWSEAQGLLGYLPAWPRFLSSLLAH